MNQVLTKYKCLIFFCHTTLNCSYRTLATPTEDTWPGVKNLPDYKATFPQWTQRNLAEATKNLMPESAFDLLEVSLWNLQSLYSWSAVVNKFFFFLNEEDIDLQPSQEDHCQGYVGAWIFQRNRSLVPSCSNLLIPCGYLRKLFSSRNQWFFSFKSQWSFYSTCLTQCSKLFYQGSKDK